MNFFSGPSENNFLGPPPPPPSKGGPVDFQLLSLEGLIFTIGRGNLYRLTPCCRHCVGVGRGLAPLVLNVGCSWR